MAASMGSSHSMGMQMGASKSAGRAGGISASTNSNVLQQMQLGAGVNEYN